MYYYFSNYFFIHFRIYQVAHFYSMIIYIHCLLTAIFAHDLFV